MYRFLLFHQIKNDQPSVWQHAVLHRLAQVLPGILLSAAIGAAAIALGRLPWLQAHGVSALTMAIVLGVLLGNTLYPRIASDYGKGVGFSKQSLLRLGIVLYGFRLTFKDIGHVGLTGVAIDALVLTSTFTLALFVGIKLLKLELDTVILI
ncbi:MAG: putative sulfate exporter family transporter, partial [Burkholderiales bacterium]